VGQGGEVRGHQGRVIHESVLGFNGKAVFMPLPAQTTPPGSGRLGLADLKRAAQERRARQDAGRAGGPASRAGT
jgi:hypothetical protein